VAGGLGVARATGSAALLGAVRDAYTSGLDVMLWVCAGIAVAAALLAAAFLPRQEQPQDLEPGEHEASIAEIAGAE
jgi:Na+/proline symporter